MENMEKAYYRPGQQDEVNIREYSLRQNMTMLKENLPGKNSRSWIAKELAVLYRIILVARVST